MTHSQASRPISTVNPPSVRNMNRQPSMPSGLAMVISVVDSGPPMITETGMASVVRATAPAR